MIRMCRTEREEVLCAAWALVSGVARQTQRECRYEL
jgi:hypothetical protein